MVKIDSNPYRLEEIVKPVRWEFQTETAKILDYIGYLEENDKVNCLADQVNQQTQDNVQKQIDKMLEEDEKKREKQKFIENKK